MLEKSVFVDKMGSEDWEAVREIYLEGISTGHATFQTTAPSWEEWDCGHLCTGRLVVREESKNILGWAALSPVSGRCVYAGVAEVSIYVSSKAKKMGIGSMLMQSLIVESEISGTWTLQAGIFPENHASLSLHKKFGFREVGRRERIGKMNGVWRDTILLERRSAVVGVD